MMLCDSLLDRIQPWLRDYDSLQSLAVILIYIQIGCSLLGSLGALYNGVLLINLAIALFALVAIESSSQSLGRTYAVLLICSILLDISWFFLFSHEIWLGASYLDASVPREADYDLRNSFLSPVTSAVARQSSGSDEVLGGSIYDPAYYSSLFEDGRENKISIGGQNHAIGGNGSTSTADVSPLKLSMSRSFQSVDGQNHLIAGSVSTSAEASPLKLSIGRSFQSIDEENTSGQPQPFRI